MYATRRILLLIVGVLLCVFFIAKIFSGQWILQPSFNVGPISIRFYGLCVAAGVLAGWVLAKKRAASHGIPEEKVDDIIFWLVVGGFIGARLYHVISSAGYYSSHPSDIIKVWNGGLSIYGAMFGGVLVVFWLAKTYNLKTNVLLDWLAPSVLLGQIIGRFGNFFNYELFGYPTTLPWKMYVPEALRPEAYASTNYFHPLFLYEVLYNVVVLFLLFYLIRKYKLKPGGVFFFYLLLYNAGRFFLEFMRIDSVFYHTIRVNAVVSLVLVLTAVAYLVVRKKDVFIP
jgi:phosphatidylglycerol:prolipoprotein diacylglycerol transferase